MINVRFSKGQSGTKIIKRAFKISRALTNASRLRLVVDGDGAEYIFHPQNLTEHYRCVTFFTKEEGTLAWMKNALQEGDVFFDIGANIGLYSLYAAKLGRNVKVYAFEPHKYTFVNLMDNIAGNNLLASITPIAVPLGDACGISTMNYADMDSGSSMSQVGHSKHPGGEFAPKLQEIIYCVTLDELVEKKAVPTPNHIKIDVDGNELPILKGMKKLLASAQKPKTIQVEVNPGERPAVSELLAGFGYTIDHAHFTAGGAKSLQKGASPDSIAHNIVFKSGN